MSYINSLTGLRGMAAFIVFISHCANQGMLPAIFSNGFGQIGVMLFFILSGFLMGHLYLDKEANSDSVKLYLLARANASSENPLVEAQKRDLKNLLTKGLTRAERLIIILYYYEEMTMKEIGATLDLSESRVSQMHSSIIARLKAQMNSRRKEFALS